MSGPGPDRAVVITGASRGLGFASAVRLYREGWRVVAAMRTPEAAMPRLRAATGAGAVSYTHLTLPTKSDECRSRWSPYH